jgi:hypothetical protein
LPQLGLIGRCKVFEFGHNDPLCLAISLKKEVRPISALIDYEPGESQREGDSLRPSSGGRGGSENAIRIFDIYVS